MVKIRRNVVRRVSYLWLKFDRTRNVKLRNPSLIVAVSTSMPQYRALYSQARELGQYMLKKMEFERIATVHSSAFPPEVLVSEDGASTLPACHFYLSRGKRDLLLFTGDTSPMDNQHEFAEKLMEYAQESGVKELYSVGARWAENPLPPEQSPEPRGFATDRLGVSKLKKQGVKITTDEPAPFFASMIVAMASEHGIRGYKLSVDHGEPSPHTRSVAVLLGVLSAMAGFEISLDDLKAETKISAEPRQAGDSTIYK